MHDIQIFSSTDLIIVSLAVALVIAIIYIIRLKHLYDREKSRRLMPFLTFEFDEFGRGIFLKNEGICAAKDIKVEDLTFSLNYDFKKTLIFKFDVIDMIQPGKKEELVFKIYDKEYVVASEEFDNILGRLSRDSFEVRMTYSNLENIRFSCVLVKEKEKILVKKVSPCRSK